MFDTLLVGTISGVAILGFYDRSYRLAHWPTLLVTSVITKALFFVLFVILIPN